MNRPIRLALAAVAVALTPQIARADVGPPLTSVKVFCQPGSINNCFAFAITSEDGHLTYYLQNLQGSIQAGGPQFAINFLEFRSANILGNAGSGPFTQSATFYPYGFSFEGDVLRGGNQYIEDSNAASVFLRQYLPQAGSGLIGCTNSRVGEVERVMFIVGQTCLPTGLDGWMRFDTFSMLFAYPGGDPLRPATPEDFFVSVQGCTVYVGALSGTPADRAMNCDTNIDYASLRAGFTTAPEPASMALVATGLLGTGLFGRRRRKG